MAKDAVASVDRWAARDSIGLMIKAIQNELVAVDDRSFRWVLKKPFPKMLLALGKNSTPVCFVMPARIAATDPFKQITEYVGSGPMRFVRNEWVPGGKAVFEKFAGYVPRNEPGSWLAGGKRVLVDRIEWIVMPDQATAAGAESGYAGQPVTCLVAQDQPITKPQGDITADLLKRLGIDIEFVATDWGTVGARRAVKTPPARGGWNMFHTWLAGNDCIYPDNNLIRANGDKAWF